MLKIRNDLSKFGIPDASYFKWDDSNDIFELLPNHGYLGNVELLWSKYFEALFKPEGKNKDFNLIRMLRNWKYNPNENLGMLYDYLKNHDGSVNTDNLLRILIARPDDPEIDGLLNLVPRDADKDRVTKLFNYKRFISKASFREFVYLLGVDVCPYCGRSFTSTIRTRNNEYYRTNQVDHFIPQSIYPQFALSIWNFIPACASCNLTKLDKQFKELPYPYNDEMGDLMRFEITATQDIDYIMSFKRRNQVGLKLAEHKEQNTDEEAALLTRLKNEAEVFHIEELYSAHGDYVSDICLQRMVFNDAYIDEIISYYPEFFASREDVCRLLYMKSIDRDALGSAPLDKLTRDIHFYMKELIEKSKKPI